MIMLYSEGIRTVCPVSIPDTPSPVLPKGFGRAVFSCLIH